jgi:hypothetical protein
MHRGHLFWLVSGYRTTTAYLQHYTIKKNDERKWTTSISGFHHKTGLPTVASMQPKTPLFTSAT